MKIQHTLAAASLVLGLSLSAGEWGVLPVLDDDYKAEHGYALMVGYQDPNIDNVDGALAYGVEASLNCPLLKVPMNYIRQKISISYSDNDDLTLTSIEINPYYRMPIVTDLEVGVGPSLGATIAKANGESVTKFGYGLGADIEYDMGGMFLAFEARYQLTSEADFGNGAKTELDNLRTMAKIGYKFK